MHAGPGQADRESSTPATRQQREQSSLKPSLVSQSGPAGRRQHIAMATPVAVAPEKPTLLAAPERCVQHCIAAGLTLSEG